MKCEKTLIHLITFSLLFFYFWKMKISTLPHLIEKIIGSKQKFWILGTETFSWSSSQRRGPTPRGDYILALYNKRVQTDLIIHGKIFSGLSSEYRHVTHFAENCVLTLKNKPLPNEKVFSGLSSEYRHVTRFAQNGVPTYKNKPLPNKKVFSGLSSDF